MIFLAGAIFCSFSITMLIKYNESRELDRVVILFFNYLLATVLSLALAAYEGSFAFGTSTLLLGLGGGIIWPAGFFLLMMGIREYGMSVTGPLARLSLSVPVLTGILFLRESLTPQITIGLLLTFTAFFLINPLKKDAVKRLDPRATLLFLALIVVLGSSDVWMKVFNVNGVASEKTMFLTLIFAFAGVITAVAIVRGKARINMKAAMLGLILGIPNYFTSYLLIEALKDPLFLNQSAVAYSLYSVSILILTFLAGALLWREKVTALNMLGITAAVFAVILLNIQG